MAQRMKIEAGALNVRAHPHDERTYHRLFQAAFDLKKAVKIYGDRHGMITSLDRRGTDNDVVKGTITTFVELDLTGPWLNTETLQEAGNNEVQRIVIPDYLRPNLTSFYFAFLVREHEIIFEHYGSGNRLTHRSAETFFKRLFSERTIARQFGDVKVTIVQSRGSIDRIFSIPRITELEVYIERPNADIWDIGFEEKAEEHLEEKHARSMLVRYRAERGESIKRDDDLDALVRTSIRNGRSVAKGYGTDGHMVVTTDSFPRVEQERFDPEQMSDDQAFTGLVRRFRRR